MSIIGTTSRYRHYTIQITTLLLVILLFHTGITPAALAQDDNPLEKETQYFSSEKVDTLPDGRTIYKAVMAGPSSPPEGFAEETVNLEDPAVQAITIQLNEVPAFNWVFGCSAVSGAMIAGYYDRTSLPNVYTGPSNGGVIPLTSSMWGTWKDGAGINYPKNPLIASMIGLDGRAIKGSIEDYWISSGSLAADPYITGIWTQHAWGDAVGDYMKTSQSVYGNTDGATTFYYTDDGYPLNCDDTEAYGALEDGAVGYREFYEARGYDVGRCYTQLTDNQGIPGGFTYAQFKQQIDNGRPVMIHVQGHTMVGVGYSTTSNTIYIHDTWNYNTNAMPWGGYYYGMRMWGVTIVTPVLGNDSIHEPIEITGFPSTYSQNTTDDSHNSDEPDFTACGQEAPLASVWYTFTPVSDGEVYIDTLGSNYNTMLGIWRGSPGD